MEPNDMIALLSGIFSLFDSALAYFKEKEKWDIEKIKSIGILLRVLCHCIFR